MKGGAHKKHFLGAWKTLKHQPHIWWLGIFASALGGGLVLDTLASMLISLHLVANTDATLGDLGELIAATSWQSWLFILAIVIVGTFAQAAVIHLTYQHAKSRKRVTVRHAAHLAARRFPALIGIHGLVWLALFGLFGAGWSVIATLQSYNPTANLLLELGVLLVLGVLTFGFLVVEVLALQLAVGKNDDAVEAIGDALMMLKRSSAIILEHNLILLAINILVMLLGLLLATLAFFLVTSAFALLIGPSLVAGMLIAYLTFILTFAALTAFNLASWSRLCRSLERGHISSSLKRIAHTYLP